MREVVLNSSQTIFDVALQHYGDINMVNRIIELNPDLQRPQPLKFYDGQKIIVDIVDNTTTSLLTDGGKFDLYTEGEEHKQNGIGYDYLGIDMIIG